MREASLTREEILVAAFLARFDIHAPDIQKKLEEGGLIGAHDGARPFAAYPYEFFYMGDNFG